MKPFKVIKHFAKAVKQDIVFLGFPKNALADYVDEKQIISREDKMICFGNNVTTDPFFPLEIEGYEKWKDGISPSVTIARKSQEDLSVAHVSQKEYEVLKRLKNIRVETVTPMDCVQLVVSLQNELDGCL